MDSGGRDGLLGRNRYYIGALSALEHTKCLQFLSIVDKVLCEMETNLLAEDKVKGAWK
jgi:hypothetical protein